VEDNSDTELPTEYNTRYGRKVIRTQRWIERNEKDRASSCHTADIRLQLEDQIKRTPDAKGKSCTQMQREKNRI